MWKMQYPEDVKEATHEYGGKPQPFVEADMNKVADDKVISLVIAIGVSININDSLLS